MPPAWNESTSLMLICLNNFESCVLHVHSDKTVVPSIHTVAHLVQFETGLCHGD